MRSPRKCHTLGLALRFAFVICFAMSLAVVAPGQAEPPGGRGAASTPAQKENAPAVGTLTGIVTGDDGRPLSNAQVYLTPARKAPVFIVGKAATTGADGRFRYNNLPRRAFNLLVMSPGYAMPEMDSLFETRPSYRPGDSVSITLAKGGVITGTVSDVTGAPMVEVMVTALRVRDANGRPAQQTVAQNAAVTDDRGIYRIYSLPPGAYLVSAGAIGQEGDFQIENSSYELAPIYYPSSSMEAALEVNVGVGQEATGIDIRVRGEGGHDVSGSIAGATSAADGQTTGIVTVLRRAATGLAVGSSMVSERNGKVVFAFSQVPDGDYELSAETWRMNSGVGAGAEPLRIKVRGADLSGLQLVLSRYGSISGRVVLESLPVAAAKEKPECATIGRPAVAEEFNFGLRRATGAKQASFDSLLSQPVIQPDEQGKFTADGTAAGTYWLQPDFPGERYYLRSLTITSRPGKPVDAGRTGLNVGPGEELKGVIIAVSEGAARLEGKLSPADAKLGLPARSLLHLVPAETEAADDVLRYRELKVSSDGVFTIANVAPGKYWLYAEALPDTDARESLRRPVAWDAATRLKLRRTAEAANQGIELKQCQRMNELTVPLARGTVR
jgi:hypothetical protein